MLLVPSSGFDELFVKVEWGAGTSIMDNLPGSSAPSASSSSSSTNGSSTSSAKKVRMGGGRPLVRAAQWSPDQQKGATHLLARGSRAAQRLWDMQAGRTVCPD